MKNWLKRIKSKFIKEKDAKHSKADLEQIKKNKPIQPKVEEEVKPIQPKVEEEVKPIQTKVEEEVNFKKSKLNWFNKLGNRFKQTSSNIKKAIFLKKLDNTSISDIEEAFLISDLGVTYTDLLINEIKKEKFDALDINSQVANFLENQFDGIDHKLDLIPENNLRVMLVFGVNGSGKTTTIAKIANQAKNQNLKVMMVAADTFRAAAVEQLQNWGNKIGIKVICGKDKEDPSSVVFKSHRIAIEEEYNLMIVDTAGRLHNRIELMDELKKMLRIIKKNDVTAPHNQILVLDSTIGQNTYNQIDSFNQQVGISGVIMTKLDGSAKGGALIGIAKKYKIPIHALGIGEKIDDLIPFVPKDFVSALLGNNLGNDI